ncbi:T9SS type A sorting domain-containing protein [Sphingobacterium spiritivorum]
MQGNRNPFIDNPYLATLIWNGPQAEDTWDLQNLSTGVSYTYSEKIKLYPTVTTDYVNVVYPNGNTFQYVIYNQMGQKIMSGKTTDKIDVSGYSSGMYYIILESNNHYNSYKIIKQ